MIGWIKKLFIKKAIKEGGEKVGALIDGKKGYIAGGLWILYGAISALLNIITWDEAAKHIITGFTIIAGRSAMKKAEPTV